MQAEQTAELVSLLGVQAEQTAELVSLLGVQAEQTAELSEFTRSASLTDSRTK